MNTSKLILLLSLLTFSLFWSSCENGQPKTDEATYTAEDQSASTISNNEQQSVPTPKIPEANIYGTYYQDKERSECKYDGQETVFQRVTIKKDATYEKGFELTLVMDERDTLEGLIVMKGKMTGKKTFEIPKQSDPCYEFDCEFVKGDGEILNNDEVKLNITLIEEELDDMKCSLVAVKKQKGNSKEKIAESAETVYDVMREVLGGTMEFSYSSKGAEEQAALPKSTFGFLEAYRRALKALVKDGLRQGDEIEKYMQGGNMSLQPNIPYDPNKMSWNEFYETHYFWPPGDDPGENWIFDLNFPNDRDNDNLYWVVVPRDGGEAKVSSFN